MKILMVAPMPPQARGHGAIPLVLNAQLVGLAPRHEITLATVVGKEPGESEAVERIREMGVEVHAVRGEEPRGLQRWRRRWRLGSSWLRGFYPWRTVWFWEPALQEVLDRLLAGRRFNIVAVDDNAAGVYRFGAASPCLLTEHEVRKPRAMDWRGWRGGAGRWALRELDWLRWRRYQPAVWRRFRLIQVFTERDAQALLRLAPDLAGRVRVNPFGIELPPPADPGQEREGCLAFVGNFTHFPNVDAALWLASEIMPRLRARCPQACLTLVGAYPPAEVRSLAREGIHLAGEVPEVEPYLEQAAVIVAPLRVGGGMRMKVLQAMALGKAVVTTPRGAEGLSEAGCPPPLAIGEDAEGIAEQTAALLANGPARRALGERARAHAAEHFSAAAYARRLEAVYAEAAAGN